MPLQPGTRLQDRYQIERVLGRGGFGAVYLAQDERLGIACAVKENLNPTAEAERQFHREAGLLARLRHRNLPRVTHHFIDGGHQYLVMDFIEGEDLGEWLRRQGPLPLDEVLRWAHHIGQALSYLHSLDPPVTHRDIKPANIKIAPNGEAILVDFGIAKAAAPDQATSVSAKGVTPGFAPPEQYGLGHTDTRADVYALSATLYTLWTGQVPPDGVERLVGEAKIVPLAVLRPDLPAHVARAVEWGMEPARERRLPSVHALLRALMDPDYAWEPSGEVSRGETPRAEPTTATRVERRHRRRVRALLAVLTGVLVVGLAAVGVDYGERWLGEQESRLVQMLQIGPALGQLLGTRTVVWIVITATPRPPIGLAGQEAATAPRTPTPVHSPTATRPPEVVSAGKASTWRLYTAFDVGDSDPVFALNPDGTDLAVVRDEGIDLIDLLSGVAERRLEGFLVGRTVRSMAYVEGELVLLTEDELIRWDIALNNQRRRTGSSAQELVASPSGALLALRERYILVADRLTGHSLGRWGDPEREQPFALSPDDRYLALGVGDDVELWNVNTGQLEARLLGHGESTEGLAFTADGDRLVSSAGDIWQVASTSRLAVFDSSTSAIAISPNAEIIVGGDGSVWSMASGAAIGVVPFEEETSGRLLFTPDGRFLVRERLGEIQIWVIDPRPEVAALPVVQESVDELEAIEAGTLARLGLDRSLGPGAYDGFRLSPSGQLVAVWRGPAVSIFEVDSGELQGEFHSSRTVNDADFLGNEFVLVLNESHGVERWDVSTRRLKQTYDIAGARRLAAAPDGLRFAAQGKYIWVMEVLTGKRLHTLGTADAYQDFTFSGDGRRLFIAAGSGVGVWDMVTGSYVTQLAGHGIDVRGLALTPDGSRLAAASGDVWDVTSGELVASFDSSAGRAAVSPDGQLVFLADGLVWNASTGHYLGDLGHPARALAIAPDGRRFLWQATGGAVRIDSVRPLEQVSLAEPSPDSIAALTPLTPDTASRLGLHGWWGTDALFNARFSLDEVAPGAASFGPGSYRDLVASPDGVTLTALDQDGIDVLDPAAGRVLGSYRIFFNPEDIVEIAFAGDDLLVRKEQAGVERWDLETQSLRARYEVEGGLLTVAGNGRWFALADGLEVSVVEVTTRQIVAQWRVSGGSVEGLAFHGDRLAVAHAGLVEVWEIPGATRLLTLRSQRSPVGTIAFTADGERIVAANGTVWDVASRVRLLQFANGASRLALTPDGAVAVGDDGGVWDLGDGTRRATLLDLRGRPEDLLFVATGRAVAARLADGRTYVWTVQPTATAVSTLLPADTITAANVARLQRLGHLGRGRLRDALWSPDSEYLGVNTTSNAVLYRTPDLERIAGFLNARILAFDGENILVGGKTPMRLLDIGTGEIVQAFDMSGIQAAAFSSDGRWLAVAGSVEATGGADGLAVIDRGDGLLRVFDRGRAQTALITDIEFTSDSERIVVSFAGNIGFWDVESGRAAREPILGNTGPAVLSPDGQRVAYPTRSQIVIETVGSGHSLARIPRSDWPYYPESLSVQKLEAVGLFFNREGRLIVVYTRLDYGETQPEVVLLEWKTDELAVVRRLGSFPFSVVESLYTQQYENEQPRRLPAFGLSPDETLAYSLTADGIVRVWGVSPNALRAESHPDLLDGFAVSPDGLRVALPDALGAIGLWELETGSQATTLTGDWFPRELAFGSPSTITVVQAGGLVARVRTDSGERLDTQTLSGWTVSDLLDLSDDGRLVATLRRQFSLNQLVVYGLSADGPLLDLGRFPLAAWPVFSPDGAQVAIARRMQVEVWDMQSQQLRHTLEAQGSQPGNLVFSPDGRLLVSASGQVWELDEDRLLATFGSTADEVRVSPSGDLVVGQDGSLWNARSGELLGRLEGLRAAAVNFGFTPDGSRLLWQTGDGILEVWGLTP